MWLNLYLYKGWFVMNMKFVSSSFCICILFNFVQFVFVHFYARNIFLYFHLLLKIEFTCPVYLKYFEICETVLWVRIACECHQHVAYTFVKADVKLMLLQWLCVPNSEHNFRTKQP